MGEVVIYHNPNCSKSRQTLDLLQARGVEPRVVHYVDEPPTVAEVTQILALLGLEPRGLMRTKEPIYEALGLDRIVDRSALIAAIVTHPILMERPVVIADGRAAIGRPPENVLNIL